MQDLIKLILGFFTGKFDSQPTPTKETPTKETKVEINWADPKAKVSKYFTVHECLFLPSWNIHHIPSEEQKANLLQLLDKMDAVREFLGKPISVHCALRPGKVNCPGNEHDGQDYNAFIKGATHSAHLTGLAMDFDCGENCDDTRTKLLPKLEEMGLCMENLKGPWVHLDVCDPVKHGGNRYFIP